MKQYKISAQIEKIRKKQMEILDLKQAISKIKQASKGFTARG